MLSREIKKYVVIFVSQMKLRSEKYPSDLIGGILSKIRFIEPSSLHDFSVQELQAQREPMQPPT